ncbi:MAG TPA: PP2C family protein-serine/threonine phosphatase [Streptosporangiaceae bacterium]
MADDEQDLDAAAGRAAVSLVQRSHLLPPGDVARTLAEAAAPLGVTGAAVHMADLQQRYLWVVPGGITQDEQPLDIESSLAGLAFRTLDAQVVPAGGGTSRVWLPLLDGTERLGVIELLCTDVGQRMLPRLTMLASLAGLLVAGKSTYSDTYARAKRSHEMAVQGELVWAMLAPRTFATTRVLVAASIEPAYEVGGDAFDYSLAGDLLHVSLFDASGHDLAAGLVASVAMASARSTRRAGGSLAEAVTNADQAVGSHFAQDRFATALLCDLDLSSGQFRWIPCGHPPPLLIRGSDIRELYARPHLPLGLSEIDRIVRAQRGLPAPSGPPPVYSEQLRPGDRLLLYTDGVTEGRSKDGLSFGLRRLSEFIVGLGAAGTPAPEALRLLSNHVLEHQAGRLSDDATVVVVEWLPGEPVVTLAP